MKKDNLGTRMKEYEYVTRTKLTRRTPVVIRLDGKAFHTFTRGFQKPFDSILMETMWETSKELCKDVQGCKLAYTQSDEISLLIVDYDKLDSAAWFDNNIQKMASVSASTATLAFNKHFARLVDKFINTINNVTDSIEDREYLFDTYGIKLEKTRVFGEDTDEYDEDDFAMCVPLEYYKLAQTYTSRKMTAVFDSRVFNIPREDVNNYFVWRQQDSSKNSISMVAQSNFSHKELQGKSGNDKQEMLFQEHGINWSKLPTYQKRGACITRQLYTLDNEEQTIRSKWEVDKDIPEFTQNKYYIEQYV